jgi:peptide/nickel transport system substrate-binding protein
VTIQETIMMDNSSRRDFLRATTMLGGGLLMGSLLPGCGEQSPKSGGASSATALSSSADEKPRRGGRLRLGIIGGDQAGNLDAHKPFNTGSIIRGFALYSKLWEWNDDMLPKLTLAEFAEPNADASQWTIRLKKGLEFHHGKTVTADDVVFSILRLTDPGLASPFSYLVNAVDREGIAKIDEFTVRIAFKKGIGFSPLPSLWVNFGGIVPTDYHPVTNPVGAGPFKYKDFRPGERSLFVRHENYFLNGQPYPDELEILDFKDQTSRFAALVSGQIHLANAVSPDQIALFRDNPRARLLVSPTYAWNGFYLNTAKKPFDDIRVRQAFRLLVDRGELVKRVFNGEGRIANDLYAAHDPTFNHDIPQRLHDPDGARRLLREAGVGKLSLELVTNAAGSNAAVVFAEQARRFDIDLHIRQVDEATYNGSEKADWAISTGGSLGLPYLAAAVSIDGPLAVANRSNFYDARFHDLIHQALKEPDVERQKTIVHEAQRIQHERGSLLIWGFANALDGVSPLVGIQAERSHFPTWRFDRLWLREDTA